MENTKICDTMPYSVPKNEMQELMSIVILSYENSDYLTTMLDSVFEQDYPQIQLIISDDCSSNFDYQKVKAYCKQYASPSIIDIKILHGKAHKGTVANLESALPFCEGAYIWVLAADDQIAFSGAATGLIKAFNEYNEDTLLITSQVELFDEKLSCRIGEYLSLEQIELLRSGTSKEQFIEFAKCCWVPAVGTCYRRQLLNLIGNLSSHFFLIEDWPMYIRATIKGKRIGWSGITTVRHRHGGISHGQERNTDIIAKYYSKDLINIYRYEISPFLYQIPYRKRIGIYCRAILRYIHHFNPLINKFINKIII